MFILALAIAHVGKLTKAKFLEDGNNFYDFSHFLGVF